ncbi:MAG: hypothetical protein ACFFFB_21270 [Candidatus Heimdallarchaeota archaeon]
MISIPENKVRKYFSLIEAYAWCDICEDMVALRIDKKEITDGLKMGIYTKEYKHRNPYPDPNDPDDISVREHTIYVYINDNFDLTGAHAFFGDSPSMAEVGAETLEAGGEVRIPVIVKEVSPLSVQLGMLSMDQYKVLKVCDGMNTLEQVAQISQKSIEMIDKMMEELRKKGLVKVIKRSAS